MAGLVGYLAITAGGMTPLAIDLSIDWLRNRYGGGRFIDLSKVPASAIVKPEQKPEPKRETRKVWVNFYRNRDDHSIWPSRSAAGDVATSERIACVETEVTFTHGQGLETGQ
jgi:hypothetical protein